MGHIKEFDVHWFTSTLSLPAAMAGARAADICIATADLANKMTETKQAITEAQIAAQLAAATPTQAGIPSIMFTADDISHMHDIVAPNLLVGFQKIMYDNKECFRLGQ